MYFDEYVSQICWTDNEMKLNDCTWKMNSSSAVACRMEKPQSGKTSITSLAEVIRHSQPAVSWSASGRFSGRNSCSTWRHFTGGWHDAHLFGAAPVAVALQSLHNSSMCCQAHRYLDVLSTGSMLEIMLRYSTVNLVILIWFSSLTLCVKLKMYVPCHKVVRAELQSVKSQIALRFVHHYSKITIQIWKTIG